MKNSVKKVLPKYFFSLFVCLIISINIFSLGVPSNEKSRVDTLINNDDRIKNLFLKSAKVKYKKSLWLEAKYAYHNYLLLEDDQSEQHQDALFYYAKSCFNAGDYINAVEAFSEFIAGCENSIIEDSKRIIAEWDRAIAAIKIDPFLAKNYLGSMAYDYGHKYYREARELIAML